MITFHFPTLSQLFETVKNITELKERLEHLANYHQQIMSPIQYQYRKSSKKKSIIAQCSRCQASLRYTKQIKQNGEQQFYRLQFFTTYHRHLGKTQKKQLFQKIAQKIQKYQKVGIYVTKEYVMKKFQCSQTTYYKSKQFIDNKFNAKTFKKLVNQLNDLKYEVKYEPQNDSTDTDNYKLPELLVVVSSDMKKEYEKYGKCLFLDTTYNLCKDKPDFQLDQQIRSYNMIRTNLDKKRMRQFVVITMFGLNAFRKIIVFGFAIVLDKNATTMYRVLKTFFQFHQKTNTQTIKRQLFCFSHIPKTFIHGTFSFSLSQELKYILKTGITIAQNYVPLVQKICKMFKILNYQSQKVEKNTISTSQTSGLEFLEACKKYCCKTIFNKIVEQFMSSKYNCVTTHNNIDEIKYIVTNDIYQENLQVRKEQLTLKCECGFKQKTLLPCSHVISILIHQQREIFDQIDHFYKQDLIRLLIKKEISPQTGVQTRKRST